MGAADGDIVHVVARGLGVGAELSPSGHPAEHQLRIAGERHVRTKAQTFHDARPKTLEHGIRCFHKLEARLDGRRRLQVHGDGSPSPRGDIRFRAPATAFAVDAHHIGPEVR
jgi:hypothetical protein